MFNIGWRFARVMLFQGSVLGSQVSAYYIIE
jgi:hypothetical protein